MFVWEEGGWGLTGGRVIMRGDGGWIEGQRAEKEGGKKEMSE